MRLRSKLMLIVVSSAVPIVSASLVGRHFARREFSREFSRNLDRGESRVRAQYRDYLQQMTQAVERLADQEDDFLGAVLLHLARGDDDAAALRRLVRWAPRVMEQRGLDMLTVLDSRDRIVVSGHFPGRAGQREPLKHPLAKRWLARVRVMIDGRPQDRLMIGRAKRVRSPLGVTLTIVGGREIGERLLRRLRLERGVRIALLDAQGQSLAGTKLLVGAPTRRIELALGAERPAQIVLQISDERLRTLLGLINWITLFLVVGILLLAVMLGAAARRITRPIEALAAKAELVARGELEQQLPVESSDEIGELVAAFNAMTVQLAQSQRQLAAAERVAAWREIAQRIAHEIKNPLFPIQMSIDTLKKVHQRRHPDFEEVFAESTRTILEEVERLKQIVAEFSQFARMPRAVLEPAELGQLIERVLPLYPDVAFSPSSAPVLVQADEQQLRQVLINLLNNAKEAAEQHSDKPQVSVALKVEHNEALIEVSDNGAGFDDETAAQLFTPYFTTKKARGGTGLGLAIAHRIVQEHGGSIRATSSLGRGAKFVIAIPGSTAKLDQED
ncbi:MAG: HAMP domain-containing protein [Deltaproteobacteria bacterium]|nr:HAMP domain-containing protein [Deltaproteobacteria bacterium]